MSATTERLQPPSAVRVSSLIVTSSSKAYAIPIAHVVETMRPLPVEPVAGMPSFLLGVSVIRGAPVPVVDLEVVVGVGRSEVSRFVLLSLGERRVAVAVGSVVGMRELDAASIEEMAPLLRDACAEVIQGIGVLDAGLLVVLRATRLLPEEIWQKLSNRESPS